jgi:hypothetical protein
MPNNNAPFGFASFGRLEGGAPTAGMEQFQINSSDTNSYYRGDPVCLSSAAYGFLQPYQGSSLAPVCLGVFQGCEFYSPTAGKVIWFNAYVTGTGAASSTPVTAYVITDPEQRFIAQASSAGLGSSMAGGNLNVVSTSVGFGSATTGLSVATLNSASGLVGGSSYPFRIITAYSNFAPPGANGTDNSSAYNVMVVSGNNWYRNITTGIST